MKFFTNPVRTLIGLPWSGAALDVPTFQRLSLRLLLAWLLVMLLVAALYLPVTALSQRIGTNALFITLLTAWGLFSIWMLYQLTKLNVLRMRNLGLNSTALLVAVYLGTLALGVGGAALQLHFMGVGQVTPARLAGILLLPSAVLTAFIYFRSKPFWPTKVKLLKPLGASVKGETVGLFLLQTYTWYIVLKTPLSIIFPQ